MNIKNNQKGFAAQGMIIIIAIALIAGIAYYFGTKNVVAPKGGDVVVNNNHSTTTLVATTTPTPTVFTVLSPNGNENWVRGSTKTIRWSNPTTQTVSGAGGPQDEISIFINSQPTDTAPLAKTIVTGLNKNATSYDWVVGSNAENSVLSGSYYIKVCRKSFTCDWSDAPFTITN